MSRQVWAELKREHPLPDGENSFLFYLTCQLLRCGHFSGAQLGACGCPGKPWLYTVACGCGESQIWFGRCTGCKAER